MTVTASAPPLRIGPAAGRRRPRSRGAAGNPLLAVVVVVAAAALLLAELTDAFGRGALHAVVRAAAGGLVLLVVCGWPLTALLPARWRLLRPLFALALGPAASGIVLMAFGVAHVPLRVSLWLTLAIGIGASVWLRRRSSGEPATENRSELDAGRGTLAAWTAVLAIVFVVAMIPAWRTNADTIYGQNPDAAQVVGIAVLFQHVPPTATDVALPLDTVPPQWRFRYPIFYPLAAVSNLVHDDPILVFAPLAALLATITAFGFGLLAVRCFRAPPAAGPLIAGVVGLSWVVQYLTWHPYWNQLWGLTLLPLSILFGWEAIERRDVRAAVLCAIALLTLWFAYPLALPYPIVLLLGVVVAYWRRPTLPRIRGWRSWALVVVVLALLLPAIAGSVLKLEEALSQLLTPNSSLWGGDVTSFLPFGRFVGVGGGIAGALVVAVLAGVGLWALPRRARIATGVVLAVLCLLDLRFRLVLSGHYMDFKHLSFVGEIVLCAACAGVARMLWSRSWLVFVGLACAAAWAASAIVLDRATVDAQAEQVTPFLLDIRTWAHRLPPNASVNVDIPTEVGGLQLWAVYMLGSHPVNSPTPVLADTYAHAPYGYRADYALSLRYYPSAPGAPLRPFPPAFASAGPPVFEDAEFVIRKIDWPKRYDRFASNASQRLVEP